MDGKIEFISPGKTYEKTDVSPREQKRRPDFPKPVKLGTGRNGRIVYVVAEIEEWQRQQIAKRDQQLREGATPDASLGASP